MNVHVLTVVMGSRGADQIQIDYVEAATLEEALYNTWLDFCWYEEYLDPPNQGGWALYECDQIKHATGAMRYVDPYHCLYLYVGETPQALNALRNKD